ncbi:hypothetical protein GCM10027443_05130 [Pontibacter brevis]
MLTLLSCSKEEADTVSPNVSFLTAGVWTGSAVHYNGQDQTNSFEESNAIEWSNYTAKFHKDGTYAEYYDGNTLVEGVWEFENNERVIVFDRNKEDEYKVVISKLDDDELWYIQSGIEFRLKR